jgi:hypothetical protein
MSVIYFYSWLLSLSNTAWHKNVIGDEDILSVLYVGKFPDIFDDEASDQKLLTET